MANSVHRGVNEVHLQGGITVLLDGLLPRRVRLGNCVITCIALELPVAHVDLESLDTSKEFAARQARLAGPLLGRRVHRSHVVIILRAMGEL